MGSWLAYCSLHRSRVALCWDVKSRLTAIVAGALAMGDALSSGLTLSALVMWDTLETGELL